MKKLVSIISALVIISSGSCLTAFAESENSESAETTQTETTTAETEPTTVATEAPQEHYEEIPQYHEEHFDAPSEDEHFEFPADLAEPTTEYVPVEDIVLAEFESEMYVKGTQSLSPTVLPQNATDRDVYYSSSNSSVAKVDKLGKVTAVGSGSCRIYMYCGSKTVYYDLKVSVKTETIKVKSKYIILKPDQQYSLEASAQPEGASQDITYKSKNEDVAVVGPDGVITARSAGNASIIVTNKDSTILVNVIVNTEEAVAGSGKSKGKTDGSSEETGDEVADRIKSSGEDTIVVKNVKKVSSTALKELYGTDKKLIVECSGYDICLKGSDIANADNELDTELMFTSMENGLMVSTADDRNLPGAISVKLKNDTADYRYFYLCGENEDYHKLNGISDNEFTLSSVGKYVLATKEINGMKINPIWVLGGAGVILIMSLIYIFTKKRYWFW